VAIANASKVPATSIHFFDWLANGSLLAGCSQLVD